MSFIPVKYHKIAEYIYVLIGSVFVALAFNACLLPNGVASGGFSGLSTILFEVFGWEPAFVQWALNIPLFAAGWYILGGRFAMKTLVGTFFLPFVIFLTRNIDPWTTDPLLGSIFGGITIGIGLGIIFRGNGSTGGTDLLAQILNKYTNISLGMSVAILDGVVVLLSALLLSMENGMYALVALFITSKTIDFVQVGPGTSKMTLVITNKPDEVKAGIFKEVNRGVTRVSGYGGYTDSERPILMCVVEQSEFTKLKQIVKSIDASAFVVVLDANEVVGEGFKTA
ncbi:MAG: YitT family protein [Bacillaceae bacterium]